MLDAAGRLETVRRDGTLVVSYGYDANGNRVSEQPAGAAAITASFDDRDRLLSRGAVDYDFDAAGVLRSRTDTTNDETTSYDYDALGGLTGVELADGRQVDYVLDGLGRRVAKKVDGEIRFGLLYGEAVGPSAQLDPDGSVRRRFVYGTRSTVPDYMLRDGHRFRIVSDDLGSPRLVVDVDSGEVAQRLDYDAFGRVVQDTNPGFQPFGFAGGLYDADTGLVRFGARDYDLETGRWTAQDPIDFAAGDANLYGYVLGDPVNLVDPSGLYVDTAIDAGFVVYDITTLALGCGNWGSLALDTGSLFVPFVAGLGHTGELLRAAKGTGVVLARDRDRLLHAAQDPRLRDAINQLYRRDARIGSGSSMDAYRFEQRTGALLSRTGHGQKLLDRRTQLQRMFRSLEGDDRRIARDLVGDIQDALGGG